MSTSKKFLAPTAILISGLLSSGVVQASTQNLFSANSTDVSTGVFAPTKVSTQLPISSDLSGLVLTKNSESGVVYAGHRSHRSHSSHRSHYSGR